MFPRVISGSLLPQGVQLWILKRIEVEMKLSLGVEYNYTIDIYANTATACY